MGVYYIGSIPCSSGDIYHYGRKGMKWGKNIFGDLADRLSGAAKNAVSKVSDWSGYGARANRDHYSNVAKNTKGWWNAGARGAAENKASAYNAQYKNSPMGRIEGAANAVREQAQQAMSKAREQVSKAYADAAEKAGGAGKNIQAFYADVMSKAKATISKGKNLVSKYGPQFVSQIQTLGNNALAGGKSFLEGIMKKAKQAKSKATEPISRFKAREAEKRDRESEIGKKSNRDRNIMRSNIRKKYNKHMPAWNPNKPGRDFGGTFKDDGNYVPDDRYENNIANRTARFMGGQYEKYGPDTKKKKKK